jgi:hypothetical protein
MADEYFLDTALSWLQRHSFIMMLSGLVAFILAFFESPQFQAYACIISGAINLFTGFDPLYQEISIGKIANVQNLLVVVGFWSGMVGVFNYDGNPSIFLPYASFFTGSSGIVAYILSKELVG